MSDKQQIQADFQQLLQQAAQEQGRQFQQSTATLAAFAAERSADLALITGEAGFGEAVESAARSVLLQMGIEAIESADAADARVVGLIHGALTFAARALTAV